MLKVYLVVYIDDIAIMSETAADLKDALNICKSL